MVPVRIFLLQPAHTADIEPLAKRKKKMKKQGGHNRREERAASLRAGLVENAELFEARFLHESSDSLDWLDDVGTALARFVVSSAGLSEAELTARLTDPAALKMLVAEELSNHGVDDEREVATIS